MNHTEHTPNKTGNAMSYCALYGDRVWRSMPCSYTLIKLRQARIFMEHSTPTSIPFDKIRLKCLPEPPGSQASISPAKCPAPFTGNATSIHRTKIFRELSLLWDSQEVTRPEDFFPHFQNTLLTAITTKIIRF